MKLAGVSIVSIFALLFAGVVEGCPTLKATGKKYVVGGKSTYYKVHVSMGTTAINNAALTITLPDGVELDSSSTWPKRAAPSQSGADVTWTGLSLAARKHYTFRVKVDVDACAPDDLDFEANVSGGSCDVDAATVTTTIKRAKGAESCPPPPPPPPAGACTAAGTTTNGTAVYDCGKFALCSIERAFNINSLQQCIFDCLVAMPTTFYVNYDLSNTRCSCAPKLTYDFRGLVSNPNVTGFSIGENPATLSVNAICPPAQD